MKMMKIAVLGAGNGGYTTAADLTLAGHEIYLFEFDKFKENLEPIQMKGASKYLVQQETDLLK